VPSGRRLKNRWPRGESRVAVACSARVADAGCGSDASFCRSACRLWRSWPVTGARNRIARICDCRRVHGIERAPAHGFEHFRGMPPTEDVTIRIAQGESRMIRRDASAPSMRGIIRSIKMRSGPSAAQRRTASSPSVIRNRQHKKAGPMTCFQTDDAGYCRAAMAL
jgi:hypothetical protein